MQIESNEILLIYDSNDLQDREALGYAQTLQHHKLKELDVSKETLTELQLEILSDKFGAKPRDLIDKTSEYYKEHYADKDVDREDILKIIKNNPGLLNTPIAVYKGKAHFLDSPYDFIRKDLGNSGIKSRHGNEQEN